MSDEWDFYFARANDAVSSIFVDLGIRADVPIESRPWLLWVWVVLQAPKADGLATNEEGRVLRRDRRSAGFAGVGHLRCAARGAHHRQRTPRVLFLCRRTRRADDLGCHRDEGVPGIQVRDRQHVSARVGAVPHALSIGDQSRAHAQPPHARGAGGAGRRRTKCRARSNTGCISPTNPRAPPAATRWRPSISPSKTKACRRRKAKKCRSRWWSRASRAWTRTPSTA